VSPIRPLTVLALVALPLAAAAQTPIRIGQTVTGRLTVTDQRFADSSRYKLYRFDGTRGDTVTADLVSDDFDANLVLADGSGNSLARNDDGGENCNARLTYVLPQGANYRLYANSSAGAELGEYRLTLSRGKPKAPGDSTCRGFGRVTGMIQIGRTVTGTLSADDPKFPSDSTHYQRWILPVLAKQTFTVDLESSDFDAFIMLTRGRGERLVDNDDGAGGCNARLVYTAQDDHPLRVFVNTAAKGQVGRYTLRVSDGALPTEPKGNCTPRPAAAPTSHAIAIGQTRQGSLTTGDVVLTNDSTYAQAWTIQGRAGQTVTVDLESDTFDAYLFLRGPGISGGRDFQDDDSGGNCNARLTAMFPQTGEYEIVVNTAAKYTTGQFSLSVTSGSKPKSVARCSRSQ
jgi:hypothetical protein